MRTITPRDAKTLFAARGEFAVLDVREQEEFSRSHMLLASCAPYSRLEMMVLDLVPCKTVPVILVDSGEEPEFRRAEKACQVLESMGYADPRVLEGGMKGWLDAGFIEFTGVGALTKGFGEYVEEELHTPRLEPQEIKAIMDSGDPFVVIDVRPREEYGNMNIPGGVNAPGCEVTYRIGDLAPDPATTIIINCAGRTRSIIGTQTLRNAGVPNRVVALKGGTMNWQLAGYSLNYGSTIRTSPPSPAALDLARERAGKVAEKYGVKFIDAATLKAWQGESVHKTLYVFDVRQPEEFAAGHLPGSRSAQGGQLVQARDEYAAVLNARYVLVDDTEVRAVMTAHWLNQMGLPEVHVLKGGLGGSGLGAEGLERSADVPALPSAPDAALIAVSELRDLLEQPSPPLVVNVGNSKLHRAGHVPGAVWVPRGYLAKAAAAYPGPSSVVITADSEFHARLTAQDANTVWPDTVITVLEGGTPAWTAAGYPLEKDMPVALSPEDDVWYKPYTDINAKPEAMKGYFDWEFGLVERITRDGDGHFALVK